MSLDSRLRSPVVGAMADQGASSGTNFAIAVIAARRLSTIDFGKFSVFLAIVSLSIILSRGVFSEPLLLRLRNREISENEWSESILFAFVVMAGLTLLIGATFFVIFPSDQHLVGVTILGATIVPVQDMSRFVFFGKKIFWRAFMIDIAWGAVSIFGIYITKSNTLLAIVAWFVVGSFVSLVAAFFVGDLPVRVDLKAAAVNHLHSRYDSLRLGTEALLTKGSIQIIVVALTALLGLRAGAAIRTINVAISPTSVIIGGVSSVTLPYFIRKERLDPRSSIPVALYLAIVLALLSLGWIAFLTIERGQSFGDLLFGRSWRASRDVLLPLTILSLCHSSSASITNSLRAQYKLNESLKAASVLAILSAFSIVVAAITHSVTAACWVLTSAGAIWLCINTISLRSRPIHLVDPYQS